MSDTEIFKSSVAEAGNIAVTIGQAAVAGDSRLNIAISKTNLSVVGNIRDLGTQLFSCNTEFKQLVMDDSINILNIAEVFDDFDTGMSENMNIR